MLLNTIHDQNEIFEIVSITLNRSKCKVTEYGIRI